MRCHKCGAEGPIDPNRNQGRAVAVEMWDRRAGFGRLRDSLREMVRIVEAMRMSTGLGENQSERLARAKSLLENAVVTHAETGSRTHGEIRPR